MRIVEFSVRVDHENYPDQIKQHIAEVLARPDVVEKLIEDRKRGAFNGGGELAEDIAAMLFARELEQLLASQKGVAHVWFPGVSLDKYLPS